MLPTNSVKQASDSYVLIVDDDQNIQALMEAVVGMRGFKARSASSGKEALSIIEQRTPGLVILDLMMPGMSGFDVLSRMQRVNATRHVPVLILTGSRMTIENVPDIHHVVIGVLQKGDMDIASVVNMISDAMRAKEPG